MKTHAQALLISLEMQGFVLTPLPGDKLEIRPASRMTPELREQIQQCKTEILPLLAAMIWLRSRLTTPQSIARLIADWTGTSASPTDRSIEILMSARRVLGVEAYTDAGDRLTWRLPQETV